MNLLSKGGGVAHLTVLLVRFRFDRAGSYEHQMDCKGDTLCPKEDQKWLCVTVSRAGPQVFSLLDTTSKTPLSYADWSPTQPFRSLAVGVVENGATDLPLAHSLAEALLKGKANRDMFSACAKTSKVYYRGSR